MNSMISTALPAPGAAEQPGLAVFDAGAERLAGDGRHGTVDLGDDADRYLLPSFFSD